MPDDEFVTPGWRPEYTGDTGLGDVGSGARLGAHCYYLYRAGRHELPGVARTYSELVNKVHGVRGTMRTLFDVPGRGMEPAHLRLLELRNELHDVLRLTCLRLQEAGDALAATAAAYAATDAEAVDEFDRLLDEVAMVGGDDPAGTDWTAQPPVVPEPPPFNAPFPEHPHDDPREMRPTP